MFKLDLNKQFTGIDGKPLIPQKVVNGSVVDDLEAGHMGKFLATTLANASKGELLKVWPWAQKLFAGNPIEFDLADKIWLSGFIKEHQGMTNLAKFQLCEAIDQLKEA